MSMGQERKHGKILDTRGSSQRQDASTVGSVFGPHTLLNELNSVLNGPLIIFKKTSKSWYVLMSEVETSDCFLFSVSSQ